MKKHIFTLIAILSIFSACKKDNDSNNTPGTATGDYQPLTTGSTWTYRNETANPDALAAPTVTTAVTTLVGTKKVVDGKTYFLAKTVEGNDTEETYLGVNNHVYSTLVIDQDGNNEVSYLDDSKAAGYSSVIPLNIQGADARLKTTVVEKGITKTIQNKAYSNVIHTRIETQFKDGANYKTNFTVDFYVAKGVGVIGIYSTINGETLTKSELVSSVIK